MRIAFDMSSVMWTGLLVGKDKEAVAVEHNGKTVYVNSADYGYENCVNLMVKAIKENNLSPRDVIMVFEGFDAKKRRCMIDPGYKANRDNSRPPEAYVQLEALKIKLTQAFRDVGAIAVSQPFVEGDDVLAWLAAHAEEDLVIVTNDNDMLVLNGHNEHGAFIQTRINGDKAINKYGDFDLKLITLYKSLVGDTSDNIKGCPGFGPAAFLAVNAGYGDDGCFELLDLIKEGKRNELAQIAKDNNCKYLTKIADNWDEVTKSYRLCLLHPEWVNTVRTQLEWMPGMVKPNVPDERLRQWKAQVRLIDASNYDEALEFFRSKMEETPEVALDFETTTPAESDDWLEGRDKKGVDVLGSTIVSCCLTFGKNAQYGFYVTVDHANSNNVTLEQLACMIAAVPKDKFIVAHNAAGFELPVAYNAFGKLWADNGWRGFIPNMVDSRIAATFWDENQPSFGLKKLTKLLLNYDQATYAETTTKTGPVGTLPKGGQVVSSTEEKINSDGSAEPATETRQYKMDELEAREVVAYGVDDGYTASALWNFFKLFMQCEHTYKPFIELEQKPMYLSAKSYVDGLDVDIPRLKMLEKRDQELSDKCWAVLESYLIEKGWDGVTCPVFTELTPATIKEMVKIITGEELKTMVRTVSKLAILVGEIDESLGVLIERGDLNNINKLVALHFDGKPDFNVGSPKQISHLLYEVIGIPVRLRNKVTAAMRASGVREGNPRTDEDAVKMAIKMGDVSGREAEVMQALLDMKSCNTRKALYWSAYPKFIHWKTGRMHPEVNQSNTNTRRWTGSNPNIQQMESDPEGVRSVIRLLGCLTASLDQSSQEVRLMAELSQDPGLLSCYVGDNLKDTHSLVGHRIAGVTYEEFMAMRKSPDAEVATKANSTRQLAKLVFFAYLYGGAAAKIAETLGISESEAQSYIDAIHLAFPGIKRYQDESSQMAEKMGYVPIIGGTRRHLAKLVTSDDKFEASKAKRQAGNARIQGAAANQIKQVMTRIWDGNLPETTSFRWLFPVHDEVVIAGKRDDMPLIIEEVHKIMTLPFLGSVPSESSIGIGKNFGQLIEMPENEFKGGKFNRQLIVDAIEKLTGETV